MAGVAQNHGYSTYQAGNGRRYLVHLPMVSQICASSAQMAARNKYSAVETMMSPSGWFGSTVPFKSLGYNRPKAEQFREQYTRDLLSRFWEGFQSAGGGATAIGALLHARTNAATHQEELNKKFAECADTNQTSLNGLDRQLYWAQFVRDNGLTAVAVIGTGGTAATALTMQVAAGAIVTKTGLRLNDLRLAGTLGDQKQIASITMDTITDAFFCTLSTATTTATVGTKVILGVFIKAPIEGAKACMNGASLEQIGLSVGLELVGFKVDAAKDALAGLLGSKLLPVFAKDLSGVLFDAGLNAIKDQVMTTLGQPPAMATGQGLADTLKQLFNMFVNFGMDERQFLEKYVVIAK